MFIECDSLDRRLGNVRWRTNFEIKFYCFWAENRPVDKYWQRSVKNHLSGQIEFVGCR
jgi:hypothetical protein